MYKSRMNVITFNHYFSRIIKSQTIHGKRSSGHETRSHYIAIRNTCDEQLVVLVAHVTQRTEGSSFTRWFYNK